MKIEINTELKQITLDSQVNLKELYNWLETTVKGWEDWTIGMSTPIINLPTPSKYGDTAPIANPLTPYYGTPPDNFFNVICQTRQDQSKIKENIPSGCKDSML